MLIICSEITYASFPLQKFKWYSFLRVDWNLLLSLGSLLPGSNLGFCLFRPHRCNHYMSCLLKFTVLMILLLGKRRWFKLDAENRPEPEDGFRKDLALHMLCYKTQHGASDRWLWVETHDYEQHANTFMNCHIGSRSFISASLAPNRPPDFGLLPPFGLLRLCWCASLQRFVTSSNRMLTLMQACSKGSSAERCADWLPW